MSGILENTVENSGIMVIYPKSSDTVTLTTGLHHWLYINTQHTQWQCTAQQQQHNDKTNNNYIPKRRTMKTTE